MEHLIIKFGKIIVIATLFFGLQSCYNDNVEDLYPSSINCDTINVTFSGNVWPIINSNCTSCHSGDFPSGNVLLSNYSEISNAANLGKLLGTIRHEPGWSPMPKNKGSLPSCDIKQIEIWVKEGTLDN